MRKNRGGQREASRGLLVDSSPGWDITVAFDSVLSQESGYLAQESYPDKILSRYAQWRSDEKREF